MVKRATPGGPAVTNKLRRPARKISAGGKTYAFTKKSGDTRTVTRTAKTATAGASRTAVFKDKGTGGTVTKTATASADAKDAKVGRYARHHATTNADGSTTYAKNPKYGGGTVTVATSVSGAPPIAKKKKK